MCASSFSSGQRPRRERAFELRLTDTVQLTGAVETHRLDALRDDLASARFTVDAVDDLWGTEAAAALSRGHRLPAERALTTPQRFGSVTGVPDPRSVAARARTATLAAAFVLGLPVSRDALDEALPTVRSEGAATLGLVEFDGGRARSLVDLRPYAFTDAQGQGAWWIASDLGELATGGALGEDHVLGVGGASMTLSGLMIDDPVESALDLGTGCGIQALHASRHAGRVIATDISERAIGFARVNAELNGVTNIEFRVGDLFEPVAGERFDRIVSNPPFVITPRAADVPAYEYRDAGMVGDALVRAVIEGIGQHLTAGGVAQLLGNWEYRAGVGSLDRVSGWLDALYAAGHGLDSWIVEREVQDPEEYAETWIRDGGTRPDMPGFQRLYRAWLDDFELRGVTAVGFGYVTLRRPTSGVPTLRRLEHVGSGGANASGLGSHIAATIDAHDWQAARDDVQLAAARLRVADDVTEERHYWPGADDPTVIALHAGGGFGRTVSAGTALAAFVGACDGELSVGAIVAAIAQLLNADEAALSAELLPAVRELVTIGMLAPADSAAASASGSAA